MKLPKLIPVLLRGKWGLLWALPEPNTFGAYLSESLEEDMEMSAKVFGADYREEASELVKAVRSLNGTWVPGVIEESQRYVWNAREQAEEVIPEIWQRIAKSRLISSVRDAWGDKEIPPDLEVHSVQDRIFEGTVWTIRHKGGKCIGQDKAEFGIDRALRNIGQTRPLALESGMPFSWFTKGGVAILWGDRRGVEDALGALNVAVAEVWPEKEKAKC